MALVLSSISGSIQSSSRVGLTGSIIIANRPDNLFPSIPSDATLFVSGSSSSDYAVFGGSVVGSGSLLLKNASGVTQFNAASTGLTVSDSSGNSKFSVTSSSGNTSIGGTLTSTGVITANGGISGSLTKLTDGSSYLIAGSNIVVTTGSNGAITIAGTMNASTLVAGTDTQIQFNDGGNAFGGDAGLTYNKTTDTLNGVTGSFFAVNTSGNTSVGGGLTVTGASTLNGNVTVGDASTDTVTVNGTTTFAGSGVTTTFAGNATVNGNTTLGDASSDTVTVNGTTTFAGSGVTTTFAGNSQVGGVLGVTGSAGFNGSVTLGDASADTVTVNGTTTFAGSGVTTTFAGDVAVNGGDVTSSATTFNLLNSTVTTLNLGGAATTVEIGAATGTTSINNSLTVDGNTTLGNASSDTMTVNGFATFNNGLIGALTSSNVTAGQVVLAGTGGVLSGSNGLFWNNASGSLGIGTTQPTGKFEVAGVSGSLFAVTDSVSGSLLSVNNSSGLPILEVFSDNRLVAGDYNTNAFVISGSRVAVGTAPISTTELVVSGSSTSSDKVLLVKAGVAGQTGALVDVQNSAGSSVFLVSNTGISGSLTKLTDGSSYLIAGNNVTVTTGSNGAVTISAAMNAGALVGGSNTQLQFNDGGSFGGDSGLTYNKTTDTLTGVTGSFFSLSTSGNSSVGGALTVTGASTLNGNVTVGDASADTVTVNGTTTFAGAAVTTTFAGNATVNGNTTLGDSSADTVTVNGTATFAGAGVTTTFAGNTQVGGNLGVTGSVGLNGSVTLGDASADTVTVNGTTTFAGAAVTTTFAGDVAVNGGDVTSSATTFNLLNSTVTSLNLGGAATAIEIGAATGTTSINNSLTVDGNTILGNAATDTLTVSGSSTFLNGLSGSLTRLADGSSYLIGGNNISIVTGSNGAVTISTTADITSVTAGTGLTGGGSTGDLTLGINDSVVATVSGTTFTGAVRFNQGLSGSLTKLTDGTSAFIAGNNVTITTGSNGSVTIAASMNASALVAGTDTQIQFNDGGAFGADSGLTYNKTTDTLNGISGSFYRFSTTDNATVGGGLTVTGASTMNGNVTVGDASSDVVTVNGTTTFAGSGVTTTFAGDVAVNGGDVTSSATTFNLLNSTVTTLNLGGAATAIEIGAATGTTSINNSLTVDGNTTLGDASSDTVTVNGTTTFAGAGVTTTFAGNTQVGGILGVSGSASFNGNVTLGDAAADTITANGRATFNQGLSGSLTKLADGSSYLIGGNNISIVTGSNGAVTISTTADITSVTAGNGLTGGGSTGDLTFTVDDTKVAMISGSTFTGAVKFNAGLSGSLTKLTDGSSAFIAGNNVTITTGSNGAVTIAASMNASSLVAGVDTQVQFNDGGSSFGGDSGLTYNKTTDTLNGVTGSFFSLSTSGNSSVGGALTVTGASTLNGNVTVGDAAADTVTVNGTTTFAGSGVTTTFAGDVAVNGGDVTSSATTFNLLNATVTTLNIGGAATAVEIGAATGTTSVNNDLTVDGNTTLGNATTDTVTLTARVASNVLPSADVTYNLGSSSLRWANIYTGDLHLKNERGDYTLIEEEDFLTIRFNKTGKRYKFMLEAVPELDEELGNFSSGPKG